MKLHTDGTIEGTPEEVAAYKREMYPVVTLTEQQYPTVEREGDIGSGVPTVNHGILAETDVYGPLFSFSSSELVSELSRRTGVKHVPVLQDDELKLQIANEKRLSIQQREKEDFEDWKYILIERD